MSRTTNESEDEMFVKDQMDSPSIDEGSCGGGAVLKKGPWTSAEDAMLVDYVKKHGEGNWNSVQKHSGLSRCGKSCRLRWANHLRPNLKKGAFTEDEERVIVELHAKMGNKWARMAAHLPGRTDNEIKNYWNTRIKRRQRAGLPLYPSDMCLQALNENQRTQNTTEFGCEDTVHHNLLQADNCEIPDVIFEDFKGSQGVLSYVPPAFSDISDSSMLIQGLGSSQSFSYLSPPAMHQPKRLRESETLFHGFNGSSVLNGLPPFDQFQDYTCEKTDHVLRLSFPYDPPDPNSKNPPEFCLTPGCHTLLNGNFSASKPIPGSLKLELPSLQYPETGLGSWDTSPPQLPSLDSVDAFIQSPSPSGPVQSDSLSARNSGLLEALLHESENLKSFKSSNSSVVTPNIVDISTPNLWETGWEECCDPISPISRSSLDEKLHAKAFPGSDVMPKTVEHFSVTNGEKGLSKELDFSRPDAVIGAAWFEQSSECVKDQSIVTDAIATFLGEDFSCDYKHMTSETSTINQGWGLYSYPWNSMPAVCQLSEFP